MITSEDIQSKLREIDDYTLARNMCSSICQGSRCSLLMNHDQDAEENERDNSAAGDTYYSKLTELRIKWKEENTEGEILPLSNTVP